MSQRIELENTEVSEEEQNPHGDQYTGNHIPGCVLPGTNDDLVLDESASLLADQFVFLSDRLRRSAMVRQA